MPKKKTPQVQEPSLLCSSDAWDQVVNAYLVLNFDCKKKILEYVVQNKTNITATGVDLLSFSECIEGCAGYLPGGVGTVVVRPEMIAQLDKNLPTIEDGRPLRLAIRAFLDENIDRTRLIVKGDADPVKAEGELDAVKEALFRDDPYGDLIIAYCKCFPQKPSRPTAVAPKAKASPKNQSVASRSHSSLPATATPPLPPTNSEITMQNADIATVRDLLSKLEADASQFDACANNIRKAKRLDSDFLTGAIKQAANDVDALIHLVETLGKEADVAVQHWDTREELDKVVEQIESALARKAAKRETATFLHELAASIRSLVIQQRSRIQQEKYRSMQSLAADEVDGIANQPNPTWINDVRETGRAWLEWAFSLRDLELESVQEALREAHFTTTSEFIALGSPEWFPPPSQDQGDGKTACIAASDHSAPPLPSADESVCAPEAKSNSEVPAPSAPTISQAPVPVPDDTPRSAPDSTPSPPIVPDEPSSDKAEVHQEPPTREPAEPEPCPQAIEPSYDRIFIGWTEEDAAALARRALDETVPVERHRTMLRLICKWLANGEFGLAMHLAQADDMEGCPYGPTMSWLTEMLFLKDWVSQEQYDVWSRIGELAQNHAAHPLPEDCLKDVEPAFRLFVATAAMRPALLASSSDLASMLSHVSADQSGPYWQVVSIIVDFAKQNTPLTEEIVQAARGQVQWDEKANWFQEEKRLLHEQYNNARLNYAPATQVLKRWIEPSGFLGQIFAYVGDARKEVSGILSKHLEGIDIDSEIDRSSGRELRKHTAIDGKARHSLVSYAETVIDLARQWSRLLDARENENNPQTRQRYLGIQRSVAGEADKIRKFFADRENRAKTSFDKVVVQLASQEFESIHRMLQGEMWPQRSRCDRASILKMDSLRVIDCEDSKAPEFTAKLLDRVAQGRLSYESVMEDLSTLGRHDKTHDLLDVLHRTDAPADMIKRLSEAQMASLENWRSKMLRNLDDMQRKLGEAINKGLLAGNDYEDHKSIVEEHILGLQHNDSSPFDFQAIQADLDAIGSRLEVARNQELDNARRRLSQVDDPGIQQRINGLIDGSGDVVLAHDYIDRVERGEPLPPDHDGDGRPAFMEFFGDGRGIPGTHDDISTWLASRPFQPLGLISAVREGRVIEGVGAAGANPAPAPDTAFADALKAWFEVVRTPRQTITREALSTILRGIGFSFPDGYEYNANARPPRCSVMNLDPLQSPAPQFGSETQGRYIVLCIQECDNKAQALRQINFPQGEMSGVLMLVFAPLGRDARKALFLSCRERARNFLVLDTVLMVHLASVGTQRLRTFLACSIPFTNVQPYNFTANPLPEEMFYGRRREIEAITSLNNNSSCFVYGGRQIGKTVLLTEVHRRFHNPQADHFARHIDLKANQIGTQRPPDEIWNQLVIELSSLIPELIGDPAGVPNKEKTYPWLKQRIKQWLDQNPARRILLLLDEADAFLESDGREKMGPDKRLSVFAECDKLRVLMSDTERRFKAVLAGLHNVQRATRIANQPLVHFGEALCIGPLLNNGEAREAYRLVTEPLAGLGIFFENTDLPNSILARTNYYPNLIQIFCKNLVDHVRGRWSLLGANNEVPYYVTGADLDDVYERHELRQELREKFRLSLDLDRRFRLIVNVLAFNAEEHPQGMTVHDISKEVMGFWPKGFCVSDGTDVPLPHDSFRQLLNEMVGLGILRLSKDENLFRLRSPNVQLLLGTRYDVEADILASEKWELPPVFSPATFHGQLGTDARRRSPLTAEQAAQIEEAAYTVHVVTGSRMAGMDDLHVALSCCGIVHLINPGLNTVEQFMRWAREKAGQREARKTILFVPADRGWSPRWIEEARRYMRTLKKENALLGVVFACDPAKLWELRRSWSSVEAAANAVISLHPWHDDAVRNWLFDTPFGGQDAGTRISLREATGNWHLQLMDMNNRQGRRVAFQSILDAIKHDNKNNKGAILQSFGIVDGIQKWLLSFVANMRGAGNEEIREFAEADSSLSVDDRKELPDAIQWAEQLDYIYGSKDCWKLDGFLTKLLSPPAGETRHEQN